MTMEVQCSVDYESAWNFLKNTHGINGVNDGGEMKALTELMEEIEHDYNLPIGKNTTATVLHNYTSVNHSVALLINLFHNTLVTKSAQALNDLSSKQVIELAQEHSYKMANSWKERKESENESSEEA